MAFKLFECGPRSAVVVSLSKAPWLLWPAPGEDFQAAQVCVLWRTADPAPEDSTATLLASLSLMDPVVGGRDFYQLQSLVIFRVYYELTGSVLRIVGFLLQILLRGGSHHTHSQ